MSKQVKLSYLLFVLAIIFSILHNLIYALFKFEEPVFFILVLLSFLGFFVSIIYNLITYITKGKPKDLWKLGWLGLFGLVGLIPGFRCGLFGFFGFFGFFGAKAWPRKQTWNASKKKT